MAITYPLTPPSSPAPSGITISMTDVVGASSSPFTGQTQVQLHQGAWWTARVSLPPMSRAGWAPWAAFLGSLRGRYGTFYLPAYTLASPQGSASGTILVYGASQTGSELTCSGFAVSQAGVLKAGDMIQINTGANTELKQILADASSDGSGRATLDIWPPIRTSPSNGSTVVISNPMGLFRLTSNDRPWSAEPKPIYSGISFTAREAF